MAALRRAPRPVGHSQTAAPAPVLPWTQFSVFAIYTLILLIVGAMLFRRRDA